MNVSHLCQKVLFAISFLSSPVLILAQSALDLFNQGVEVEQSGDFAQAQSLYTQAYEAFVSEGNGEGVDASLCLHNLARAYANQGMMEESRKYNLMALEIREKCFGQVSEQYVSTLNNLAITYRASDMPTALEIQKKAIDLMEQLPQTHLQAGMFYRNLGLYYYIGDDAVNAAKYFEKALLNTEKFSEDYEWLLNALGDIYITLDNNEGMYRIMGLVEEHNAHELEKNKDCMEPKCILDRAMYYQNKGDNENAQACYNQLRSMELDDQMTAKVYEQYGIFVRQTNPEVGAESYSTAARALRNLEGQTYDCGRLFYMAGLCYFSSQKFDSAIQQLLQASEVFSSLPAEEYAKNVIDCKRTIANSYGILANQNKSVQDHEMAIKYGQEVLDYYSTAKPGEKEHANALERLASYEKFAGQYDSSIEHYKQAIEMYNALGDATGAQNASSGLTFCYAYADKHDEIADSDSGHNYDYYREQIEKVDELLAQELGDLDITKDYLGKLIYAGSLGTIAGAYCMRGDYLTRLSEESSNQDSVQALAQAKDNYAKSVDYYNLYLPELREAIRDEFRLRNANERMEIWDDCKTDLRQIGEFLVTLPVGNEDLMPELTAIMYDATLLSKGILLSSSIEFEEVLGSADPHLKDIYEQTKQNEARLASLRMSASTEEDLQEIKDLQVLNDDLQLELMRGCSEYADFTNYISYSWHDIQNKLADGDVAIEFVSIELSAWDEDNFLGALILTKDMDMPVSVPICDLKTAKAIEFCAARDEADSLIYSNPSVGLQVWGNMEQYLVGKKRIYFSADGPFNRVALEYLPWEGRPISEQFEVYRLSTTKELCYDRKSKPIKHMAIMGNIAYNGEGVIDRKTQRSLNKLRQIGGEFLFEDLDQSKREIDEIQSIMNKDKDRVVITLEGVQANEPAMKQLSGSNIDVLHIATHGAFIDKKNQTDAEAMQNSILALAGANIGGDEDHDGLITAADIAKMNLRNCDLVVLSACETGLGKLSDDGVFGLQRGFKNAGVHQLMMSLKSVYDGATADMMTAFYRNLANGSSARESLISAQKELRANGYTDAKYWAPFILLDAID